MPSVVSRPSHYGPAIKCKKYVSSMMINFLMSNLLIDQDPQRLLVDVESTINIDCASGNERG